MTDEKNTNPIKNDTVSMEGITLHHLNEGLNAKPKTSSQNRDDYTSRVSKGDSKPAEPQPPSPIK